MIGEVQKVPASEGEIARRIDLIKGMILKHHTQRQIVRYCLKHYPEWDITDRWLREYCKRAEDELKQDMREIDLRLWAYKELLFQGEIKRSALAKGDLGTALDASNSTMRWLERFGVTLSPPLEQKALEQGVKVEDVVTQINEFIEVRADEIESTT